MSYNELIKKGFKLYKSDRNGDHFKHKSFKDLSILGSYRGYTFNFKGVFYEDINEQTLFKVLEV